MATIKPFKALRPEKGLENSIAALPYDVYSREEARKVVERDPFSFLRIDRPETQFPENYDMYAPEVYEKAHSMLQDMIQKEELIKDQKYCYYVYEQTMNGRSQTGIVAVSAVDDYLNQTIKKHENTREEKEQDRIRHVDICNAQTGPIFLAYRKNQTIEEEITEAKKQSPVYDFVSSDGIRHRVFIINNDKSIIRIQNAFQLIQDIYIADGHHRCASAVKVCLKRRSENPDFTGLEEYNFFLSVLFADEQLLIMDYNRVVEDLNGLTQTEFLHAIEKKFSIEKANRDDARPIEKGNFGMYLDNQWYRLRYLGNTPKDPVEALDVSILQNEVLSPVLGIQNPKTDSRIDFIGGIRGIRELEKRTHEDSRVAFLLYPTTIGELFKVADAHLLMPPKSTWFEPKLRSGLFIHEL